MVLVKLADCIQILLQLRFVQSSRFINKGDNRFALRFHRLAQPPVAEMRVPFEKDLFHRAFRTLVDSKNNSSSPALLINGIDPELDADVGEAVRLINLD